MIDFLAHVLVYLFLLTVIAGVAWCLIQIVESLA